MAATPPPSASPSSRRVGMLFAARHRASAIARKEQPGLPFAPAIAMTRLLTGFTAALQPPSLGLGWIWLLRCRRRRRVPRPLRPGALHWRRKRTLRPASMQRLRSGHLKLRIAPRLRGRTALLSDGPRFLQLRAGRP